MLSAVPALVESVKLLSGILVFSISAILFIKANYKLYKHDLYFLIVTVLGLALGWTFRTFLFADWCFVVFLIILPVCIGIFFRFFLKGKFKTPVYFVAPAFFCIAVLFIFPLLFQFYLSFFNLNLQSLSSWVNEGRLQFVGFRNYMEVFFSPNSTKESFWVMAGRTIVWAVTNVVSHVAFGLFFALLLNRKIKLRGLYRTVLMLPWALPQLIAILAWRGEFHSTFGYVNKVLSLANDWFSWTNGEQVLRPLAMLGIQVQEWWTNPKALFVASCIVNIWLGVPFMMMICLSALQSIPKSFYEAASLDGANSVQQFFYITLPQIKPALVPATLLGLIWTFNNLNVIYLMSNNYEGADILVTDLYRQSFLFNRYSYSAAYAMIVFFMLFGLALAWFRSSRTGQSSID